jgi:hypothetical protein
MHEYQKKGVTEIAFRKSLILKGAILVVLGYKAEMAALRKKSGSKLPTPNRVLYSVSYNKR